ncbi:hypothetical protein RAA17_16835 [Komagataeibacter rhaeticus]|nr:hypothetical protein [Komagataeibacter rhaeticus]
MTAGGTRGKGDGHACRWARWWNAWMPVASRSAARSARCPGHVPYHGASGVIGHVDRALFDGPLVLLGRMAPLSRPRAGCGVFP